MNERAKILHHLTSEYSEPVRDPIWKHIYLSPALTRITQTKVFQKLNAIKQLGPTYLIYPGATHTRFSHSLGVFHLAKRMIISLINKDLKCELTLAGVKAFLCAALLHDLGHYPFAHSLKDLDIQAHERLTARQIIETPELSSIIQREIGISPHYVAAIIDLHNVPALPLAENQSHLGLFRSFLSGVIDPDKLDYLNRDAYFCGVPYGNQDVDFIYNELTLNAATGLAISMKGLAAIESLLFSKYLMYRHIYWHKNVRILTAMIKKAIFMALNKGVITAEDLYGMNDQELLHIAEKASFTPFSLMTAASRRQLYTPVYRIPFEPGNAFHLSLEQLPGRLVFETSLAGRLSERLSREVKTEEIIIDIPEKISFDIDLLIAEDGSEVPFKEAGSVFTEDIINGFCYSLRNITLLVATSPALIQEIGKFDLAALFGANA